MADEGDPPPLAVLPDDVLVLVIRALGTPAYRAVAARVCKAWRRVASSPQLWPAADLWIGDRGPWERRVDSNPPLVGWPTSSAQVLLPSDAAALLRQPRFSALQELTLHFVCGASCAEPLAAVPATVRRLVIRSEVPPAWLEEGVKLAGATLAPTPALEEIEFDPAGYGDEAALLEALAALAGGVPRQSLRRIDLRGDGNARAALKGDAPLRALAAAYPALREIGGPYLRVQQGGTAAALAELNVTPRGLVCIESWPPRGVLPLLVSRGLREFWSNARTAGGVPDALEGVGAGLETLSGAGSECDSPEEALACLNALARLSDLQTVGLHASWPSLAGPPAALAVLSRLPVRSLTLQALRPPRMGGVGAFLRGLPDACPGLEELSCMAGGGVPDVREAAREVEALVRERRDRRRALREGVAAAGAQPQPSS
eukprot:tig00021105_g18257.t1